MKLPAKVGVLVLDLLAAVLVLYSVSLIFLSNFNMGNLMVWLLTACVAGYAVFRRPLNLWFSAGAGRVVFWVLAVLAGVYLALIALSVIAFFVVMWLPTHPLWLILTVSVVFVVGVLSLFFTAGNYRNNPNLDANGTAV